MSNNVKKRKNTNKENTLTKQLNKTINKQDDKKTYNEKK
jgi:hypothetical protein